MALARAGCELPQIITSPLFTVLFLLSFFSFFFLPVIRPPIDSLIKFLQGRRPPLNGPEHFSLAAPRSPRRFSLSCPLKRELSKSCHNRKSPVADAGFVF